MAKAHHERPRAGDAHDAEGKDELAGAGRSGLKRLSRLVRERPVTTLALAAGVGALMGAELLAAGLAGGAAVLLIQRGDLRRRARDVMDNARQRISEGVRKIEHHEPRHA